MVETMRLKTSILFGFLLFAGLVLVLATLISANYENAERGACAGSGCHTEVVEDDHIINVVVQPQVPNTEEDRWSAVVIVEEWNDSSTAWEKTTRPVGGKLVLLDDEEHETILDIQFNNETGIKHLVFTVPEDMREEGTYTVFAGIEMDGELVCMKQTIELPSSPAKPQARLKLHDNGVETTQVTKYINQYGKAEVLIDGSDSYDLDKDDENRLSFGWEMNGRALSTTAQTFHYVFTEPGVYTITLTVTDTHGLTDSEEATVTILYKEYKADLEIEAFTISPEEAYSGDDLAITLKIANTGNILAEEFYVKLYDTHEDDRKSVKALFIGDLGANTTKSYHFIYQTGKLGEHFLEVRVDPGNSNNGFVEEFNEDNNDASLSFLVKEEPVALPGIAGVEYGDSEELTPGEPFVFTVLLENPSTVKTGDLMVKLYLDNTPVETVHVRPFTGEKSVDIIWTPEIPGEYLLQFSLQTTTEVKDNREESFTVQEEQGGNTGSTDTALPATILVATSALTITAIAGAALLGSSKYESVKYGLFASLMPMYTRIKKEDTLKHALRGELYHYIVDHPGQNYISIKNELELKNGTLIYHLKTLETQRFIKSIKDGRYRRFYPWGMKVNKERGQLSQIQQKIVELLDDQPGLSQSRIGETLGQSRQTINYQIGKLKKSDIVEVERRGITSKCYLSQKWKDT